jgi:serine/threonine protein phosphatase PrpC
VLGSDGIWELLTKKEVVDIVSKYVEENDSSMAARELVETASQRWFVVIFFG